jgi:condensin complex subunit 1
MEKATTERQWNDFAYAIGLFNHKDEEATKMIAAGFRGRAAGGGDDGDVTMTE